MVVAIWHALDSGAVDVAFLGQVDAVGPHRRVVLGLRFHLRDLLHLVIQRRHVVAFLQAVDSALGELVPILESVWVVDVDVRVIVVDDHDAATVRHLLQVLRGVAIGLLLLLHFRVDVVLVEGLLRNVHLVRPNSTVLSLLLSS